MQVSIHVGNSSSSWELAKGRKRIAASASRYEENSMTGAVLVQSASYPNLFDEHLTLSAEIFRHDRTMVVVMRPIAKLRKDEEASAFEA